MDIKVPKQLKVGGYTVDVLFLNHDDDLRERAFLGECHHVIKKIRVETSISKETTTETFIHEILHQVNHVYNNDELSEESITRMSNGFHQVLDQLNINFIQ
jgi:hypothetical protein